jgi:sugar phosphate isomerase/epimerase
MLGISTSWKSEVAESGVEIIEAILELGVNAVELEYRVSEPMLREMLPYLKRGNPAVNSLHNILPRPEEVPRETATGEFVSLTSPDPEERKAAVQYARRTLEWAEELGARAVVLHMGGVALEDASKALRKLYDEKKTPSEEAREFIEDCKKERARLGRGLMSPALRSLETLANEAGKRGLLLGVENRYNLHDFPAPDEFEILFRQFAGGPVRYWHDIGHATAQENLGLLRKGELLERFGGILAGVHLHGCRGYHDHYAPGTGDENLGFRKKSLRPDMVLVVETHHRASRQELLDGLAFLRKQGIT